MFPETKAVWFFCSLRMTKQQLRVPECYQNLPCLQAVMVGPLTACQQGLILCLEQTVAHRCILIDEENIIEVLGACSQYF